MDELNLLAQLSLLKIKLSEAETDARILEIQAEIKSLKSQLKSLPSFHGKIP